ncbi:polysaccharide deacetylase family protein [Neobacillus niacini]|uniref:polysaccharide deacetylase family protein n=1 Tax=Neobacillus niacini TaxID=86668 RepID=UPI002854E98B|nr:polysaccharide deacetylase family protein [Neobacillus niacini]MDR6998401.1 peptidoglycan/xylan/chitin deacetylase (PgdA/CDA1 family) [Neobacillus niacini]
MYKLLFLILGFLFFGSPTEVFAQKKVPILVYHSIAQFTGHGQKELYVTPENFEMQVGYLRDHGYTLLTFEQWQNIDLVKKPIFLTFDDGYKNNLNVFKVFQKLQTNQFKPAGTFFIISDFIGRTNRLSSDDLKSLSKSGLISIQSHTATHPDLTETENLDSELRDSKRKLEKIIGKQVIAISYPYGNVNSRVVTETKKYYLFGLTTTPGPYIKQGIENEDYLLPRTYIKYSTKLNDFAKIVK